jgi:hypothetical protein
MLDFEFHKIGERSARFSSLTFTEPNLGPVTVSTPEGIVMVLLLAELRLLRKDLAAMNRGGVK